MQPNQQLDPIFHIETDKIKPNPFQPRRDFDDESLNELASSIREFGILHPLLVTKVEISTDSGTQVEYQLIAGERRLMAAKIVGLERVPAIVRAAPSDRERLELAIIENIQRENLNPIETARAYAKLQDQFGLTQREVAVRVGKSREVVANSVRLLNLPPFIQDSVSKNQISESQARMLLMIENMQDQEVLFNDLVTNNLSVRELRNRIQAKRNMNSAVQSESAVAQHSDPETINLEEQLREILGTKVKLQKEGEGGKLTINFYSKEELDAIIGKLIQSRQELENKNDFPPTAVSSEPDLTDPFDKLRPSALRPRLEEVNPDRIEPENPQEFTV